MENFGEQSGITKPGEEGMRSAVVVWPTGLHASAVCGFFPPGDLIPLRNVGFPKDSLAKYLNCCSSRS